jgi:hypothetical protein
VLAVPADLASAEGIHDVVAATVERYGGVDVLVNNSGGPPPGRFADVTDEDWRQAFELLTLNFVRAVREVLPHMRRNRWGRIIGIQSSSVKQPVAQIDLSNGIRPGIAGLMKAIMPDLAKDRITINLVLPGMFLTSRIHPGLAAGTAHIDKTVEEQLAPTRGDDPHGTTRRSDRARTRGRVPRLRAGLLHHRRRLPGRRGQHQVQRLDDDRARRRRGVSALARRATSRAKTIGEEREDLVPSSDRRLARLVDQMGGHDTVRARHDMLEERRRVTVGRAVGKDSCNEAVAERLRVGREPLRLAVAIPLEAVGHDSQVLALESSSDGRELLGSDLEPGWVVER